MLCWPGPAWRGAFHQPLGKVKYASSEGNVPYLCPSRDKFIAPSALYNPSELRWSCWCYLNFSRVTAAGRCKQKDTAKNKKTTRWGKTESIKAGIIMFPAHRHKPPESNSDKTKTAKILWFLSRRKLTNLKFGKKNHISLVLFLGFKYFQLCSEILGEWNVFVEPVLWL